MSKLEWNDSYVTGIPRIDKQHMFLFDLTDKCIRAIADQESQKKLNYVLKTLLIYSKEHFALEEQMMKEAQYAELEPQIKEHQEFSELVNRYWVTYLEGNKVSLESLSSYLKTWLTGHILDSDLKYVESFKKADLK